VINAELRAYSPALSERPQIVVGNKIDLPGTAERRAALAAHCSARGVPFVAISAATGAGLSELVTRVAAALDEARCAPVPR
jgi:GTP-binding protein